MLANFASGGAAICVLAREAEREARRRRRGGDRRRPDRRRSIRDRRRSSGYGRPLGRARRCRARRRWARSNAGSRSPTSSPTTGSRSSVSARWGSGTPPPRARSPRRSSPRIRERVCGRGTGLDDDGLARKLDAVRRGLAANGLPRADADPIDVLAAVGGLEIAFLVGVSLGAAARRLAIVLDGFITSAAALVAARLRPAVRRFDDRRDAFDRTGARARARGARASSRSWTSASASAKGPARRSRCRSSTPRSRSSSTWRRSTRPV